MVHILIFIHWFVLVFTFGNVELVTIDNSKSNDFPIEELNGYTLREVFESGITDVYSVKDLIIDNNIYTSNGLNTTHYILTNYLLDTSHLNDKMYMYNLIETNTFLRIEYAQSSPYNTYDLLITDQINYGIYNYSKIVIPNNYDTYLRNIVFMYDGSATVSTFIDKYIVYHSSGYVNLTFLGISNLTVEQMDYWLNVYQENEQREISETYDYIENELTTNDLIYIVLFALLWGLAIKIVKGVM